MTLRTPYLLFIGDAPDQLAAKTAAGIAFWRPEISLGQFRLPGCNADLGLPDMTIEEAAAAGVKTVIVGTTNRGGVLGEGWEGLLVRGLELGMDLASGLHHRLSEIPVLRETAVWALAQGGALDREAAARAADGERDEDARRLMRRTFEEL